MKMARSNRRKLQIARSDEKSLVESRECIIKLDLESPNQNETRKTRKQINNSKEQILKSPKQPVVVLRESDFIYPDKYESTRSMAVRNEKATNQKTAQAKQVCLNATNNSLNDLRNPRTIKNGTKRKLGYQKSAVSTVINNADSKKDKQCVSIKKTERSNDSALNFNKYEILTNRKVLRKRKMLDYNEQSICTPQRSENGKIPIYRKVLDQPGKTYTRDPFTFIPDSDEDKNSDISFRINSPKKRKIVHTKTTKPKDMHDQFEKRNVKYSDKINNTLNSIRNKLNKCKKNNAKSLDVNKPSEKEKLHKIDPKVQSEAPIFCSTPKYVRCDSTRSLSRLSDQDNFNFDDNASDVSTPINTSGAINIVQNIVLNTKNSSSEKQVNRSGGSWRFETNMTRNPHLIAFKKNALPNLNQDAILDHTFDDKITKVNHTVLLPATGKSPKQQSILNYIPTSREYSKETHQSRSLFDIDELSPLKLNNKENVNVERHSSIQNSLYDINELSPLKLSNEKRQSPTRRVKRNILGQLDSNKLTGNNQTSTPYKNIRFNVPVFNVTNIENTNPVPGEHIEKIKSAQVNPFRFEVNCKNYNHKKGPDMITKPVRDSEVKRLIEKDVGFDNLVETEDLETEDVRLFEDIEAPANITKSYKPRSKKPFLDHNSPKKKKPTKMSKEALKWIKDFNLMCDEVDQVELEIE